MKKKLVHHIFFDGIDKSGKQLICKYVDILGKHKYVLSDRGIISNIVFSKMFNREYEYDLEQYKNCVFVYLTVDKDDWNIRCKITKEPQIDYEKNLNAFNEVVKDFKCSGFFVLELNTSKYSPIQIAKKIISYIEKLN